MTIYRAPNGRFAKRLPPSFWQTHHPVKAEVHTCRSRYRDGWSWCGGRTRLECTLFIRQNPAPHGFKRVIFPCDDGSYGVLLTTA